MFRESASELEGAGLKDSSLLTCRNSLAQKVLKHNSNLKASHSTIQARTLSPLAVTYSILPLLLFVRHDQAFCHFPSFISNQKNVSKSRQYRHNAVLTNIV